MGADSASTGHSTAPDDPGVLTPTLRLPRPGLRRSPVVLSRHEADPSAALYCPYVWKVDKGDTRIYSGA